MIRNNSASAPRRIAVITMARPQAARLGIIRNGDPTRNANVAWATISNETPDSNANWLSYVLMQQDNARLTTPGTLSYTPASITPAPNVAPWNSWITPNCSNTGTATPAQPTAIPAPASAAAATAAPVASGNVSKLLILLGGVGAAASLKYLFSTNRR